MWVESPNEDHFVVPDEVQELSFAIDCPTIAVDHAYALSSAINGALPWLAAEPQAALHLIHGADSGNGWERPTEALYLSRRIRLELRLPSHRIEAARALSGLTFDIDGYPLTVKQAKLKQLIPSSALYCRYITSESVEDEQLLIAEAVDYLRAAGLKFNKVLAGKRVVHRWGAGEKVSRSLFVAELTKADSVTLQQNGYGRQQHLGFGIFIPHKTLN
ncbi:type I-MYXAN CRISPR-associated protein Cas6/Cmx6 [Ectothiorhodospiraceae bacterium BW-2]|nr:type I-MYXAN CRISPR-associated protein Cas6/Cmx6 [Ectothiorhodospiraceae bacterium BW-2]